MKTNKKVLIAEDELLIAKVLRMQLEKEGYIVNNVVAESDAVNQSQIFNPDIIILDVYLKNKSSGIEAGKSIRALGNKSLIIFTTGNSYETTLNSVKSIENCIVLTKPVEFSALLRLIRTE